jgi:hypothetical protein
MRYRCEQMGVKCVPVFTKAKITYEDGVIITTEEHQHGYVRAHSLEEGVMYLAEKFYDGPDPIGKTHVREGVVVRILNRPKFCAYKLKNFSFKCLEGLVKVEATAPDMEEAQEVSE